MASNPTLMRLSPLFLIGLATGVQAQTGHWFEFKEKSGAPATLAVDTSDVQRIPAGVAGWFRLSGKPAFDIEKSSGHPLLYAVVRAVAKCDEGTLAQVALATYGLDSVMTMHTDIPARLWDFHAPLPESIAQTELQSLCLLARAKKLIE
jgi:hypothetical protein